MLQEDIQDATHTPKWEGQHLSLMFNTVLGGMFISGTFVTNVSLMDYMLS